MAEQIKPSNINWIGDIPIDWQIKRIKYLSSLKGRIGWQGLTSDEYTDEGPFLITGIDFDNGTINWNSCVHITEKRWEEAPEIHIKNGDLLITKDGTVGKVAIVTGLVGKASLNSGVLLVRTFNGFDKKFLYWVLQSEEFWTWFKLKNAGNSTIIHLYQNDFAEFCYTFPIEQEQRAIADYLDKQCAKIDSIIKDLETQIDLLQKYKKSLILETVTKGLNKDVPMKPSGIDWIGDIPTHWAVKRYKYCGNVQYGYPFDSNYFTNEETGFPLIRIRDITSGNIETYYEGNYPKEYIVQKGDVLIGMDGDFNIRIWDNEKALLNQRCCRILDHKQTSKRFMAYYLLNQLKLINDLTWSTTVKHLLAEDIKNIYVTIPSIEEQEQIADYLDSQCRKIDSILKDKQEQLEKIKQHKKSLIYEYVTGKKRVKEAINGN